MAKAPTKKETRQLEKKQQEILDKFDHYTTEFQPIRDEGDEDMRYVSGDPWTEQDKRLRQDAMRPIQVTDVLHQFFNQVINDVKLNPRAGKFAATGLGTDSRTATFYNDKWREIEYRSKAPRHYITALENCIYRSYGWTRITSRLENPRSDLHELWIEGVPNPNMIVPDPDAMEPDSADMKGLFAYHKISVKEFKQKFPNADVREFGAGLTRAKPQLKPWIKGDGNLMIAEFWEVESVIKNLFVFKNSEQARRYLSLDIQNDLPPELGLQLQSGGRVGVYEEELDDDTEPTPDDLDEIRETEDRKVMQYLTNGVEILKKPKEWFGKYIPFASCYGKVLYLDHGGKLEKQILSMTRLARNPYMALCYLATCELEMWGMMPKFPYFYYKGQLDPKELLLLQKSLHEPVAGIAINPQIDGVQGTLPHPQRQPWEPPAQALIMAKDSARRAVMDAMGITPLPTPAQRNNEKTGKALERIESSSQKGSFHWVDGYDGMIERIAFMGEDLMTPVYDTIRETATRDVKGKAIRVKINDPNDEHSINTAGTHQVTVSSAPAEASSRAAASDFLNGLIQSPNFLATVGQPLAMKIYAMSIRLVNEGPIADEIANLLDPAEGGEMTPEIMMGRLQQAKQIMQQQQQLLQKAAMEKQAKVTELQGKAAIAQVQETAETQRNRDDNETKLAVAELSAKVERLTLFFEERDRLGSRQHEADQADQDRAHDAAMAAHDASVTADEAMQDRAHDAALTETSHRHALQQSAMAPKPAAKKQKK